MQSPNRIRARVQKMDLYTPPSVAYGGAYSIRPYNRVRARVQKIDLYSPPSVASGGAYSIRPYDRVRVPIRNTDAIPQPDTCGSSKNCPVFVPVGGVWWGVCDTPLLSDTCDPSKYRCHFPTGYVWPFKKLSRFRLLRGRLWGICDTPLQLGTYDPLKY